MSTLSRIHHRRLREIHRSAGWPCHDNIEIELLAAGLVERRLAADGRETLRVSDAGVILLAQVLAGHRSAYDAHEALVERVALEMHRAGRIAWRGLSLRARVPRSVDAPGTAPREAWAIVQPDVFSIRNTSVEAYLAPAVHEIKVRRADLQSDLRNEAKRAGYLWLSSETYYVIAAGIADPQEIPGQFGVLVAHGLEAGVAPEAVRLEQARAAIRRPMLEEGHLPFGVWMALARATPVAPPIDEPQGMLGPEESGQGSGEPG